MMENQSKYPDGKLESPQHIYLSSSMFVDSCQYIASMFNAIAVVTDSSL